MFSPIRVSAVLVFILSGCAEQTLQRDSDVCQSYFEQLDRAKKLYGDIKYRGSDSTPGLAPLYARYVRLLNANGCVTRDRDLMQLETVGEELAPLTLETGEATLPPTAVHVGAMDGISNTARAKIFLAKLGYPVRTTGVMGLGRRVYIGPFDNQAAIDQAIRVMREAGFVSPYAVKYRRF